MLNALLYLLSYLPGMERELRLLSHLVRRGDTVVDLGAALGVYSLPMVALVGRTGAVHAFEPRPSAARRLNRMRRWLRLRALRIHPVAVGATLGDDAVVVPGRRRGVPGRSYLAGRAMHHDHDDGLAELQRHPTRRVVLDDYLTSSPRLPIAFIKCDIEGGELDALRGAAKTLASDRPAVLCEIEDRHVRRFGHDVGDVAAFFERCGYRQLALGTLGSADGRNQLWAPNERAGRLQAVIDTAGGTKLFTTIRRSITPAAPRVRPPSPS